jgi:hypothetical protein
LRSIARFHSLAKKTQPHQCTKFLGTTPSVWRNTCLVDGPALVARNWPRGLSRCQMPDNHLRRGRQQRLSREAWKRELQGLADELGIDITVHHLPPGTSSRVDDWRGGSRSRGYLFSGGFRPSGALLVRTVAPFLVAARQTGHADFPQPAFSCVIKPSRSAGRCDCAARHRGPSVS